MDLRFSSLFMVLTLLFLTGCGRSEPRPGTNLDLLSYVKDFEGYTGQSIGDISVNFSTNLDDGVAGLCVSYGDGRGEVEIDPETWGNGLDKQRTNLIFHELGHCFLNRNHEDVVFEDECPESFMYFQIQSNLCLVSHFDQLIEEMF